MYDCGLFFDFLVVGLKKAFLDTGLVSRCLFAARLKSDTRAVVKNMVLGERGEERWRHPKSRLEWPKYHNKFRLKVLSCLLSSAGLLKCPDQSTKCWLKCYNFQVGVARSEDHFLKRKKRFYIVKKIMNFDLFWLFWCSDHDFAQFLGSFWSHMIFLFKRLYGLFDAKIIWSSSALLPRDKEEEKERKKTFHLPIFFD